MYSYYGNSEQLAVFSEIYYDKGWKAFVDGEEVPHFRVNYILRGMVLPAGEHSIEFRFKPRSYYSGRKIASASSYLLFLLLLGAIGWEFRGKFRPASEAEETDNTDS